MTTQEIERLFSEYPIYQYAFITPSEIPFSEKVRIICKEECERYSKSWSCPPAVGTVEECKTRSLNYSHALIFSTVAEAGNAYDFQSRLETKIEHEFYTTELETKLKEAGLQVLTLSSDSCAICEECAYGTCACRHPEKMHPCIESYGIILTPLLEKLDMDYSIGEQHILWFSIMLMNLA